MSRIVLISTSLLVLVLLILAGLLLPNIPQPFMNDQDIYYSWLEGSRLLQGQNPYARVLQGDMLTNDKYATYFPVFYELSFVSEKLGVSSFESWLAFWRVVFFAFDLATAALIYVALARRNLPWLGVFTVAFWLFNRWTLEMLRVVELDFVPLFFLLLSLELFPRNKWLSLFLFSISLGVKQIAIFAVPLYLVWVWRASQEHRIRDLVLASVVIGSVPFLSAIPFLVWDARGFIYSVLFSATRAASQLRGLPRDLSAFLGGQTIYDRLLMGVLMLGVCILAWRIPTARYVAVFLVLLAFMCFNPVLYLQYIFWVVGAGLMVLCDLCDVRPSSAAQHPAPA